MTESEWVACTDPTPMLDFLRGQASERKLRLFGCGFCWHFWYRLPDERIRQAWEVAERYADGCATEEERTQAIRPLLLEERLPLWRQKGRNVEAGSLEENLLAYLHQAAVGSLHLRPRWASLTLGPPRGWEALRPEQRRIICTILHDVVGNIFRPAAIDSAVLDWDDGRGKKIAQSIYEGHAFERMPEVAEALEEAGCTDTAILDHCRQPREHVRGCWLLDLLLGKK